MFVRYEDRTIHATRGDAFYFSIEKKVGDAKYKFQPNDVVRFKVCEKKNYGKVVLMKDFLVEEETTSVNIFLDRFDTKFGEIISKPVDYWYEAELNPDTFPDTFIGYNEDGPAVFRLYPETKDVIEGEIPDPEENSAVSRMVVTFVNEYLGGNAETIINQYLENNTETLINQAVQNYFNENKLETPAAKIGIVNLLADRWEGGGNLYYQVVNIDGVTENSQVDLTPSVDQLVVFYDKDLTFVTENDGGVVTVYAIGQRPTNDYTVQVTITEVLE